MPPYRPGTEARCPRCSAVLRHGREQSLASAAALALACLIAYAITMLAPFLSLNLLGRTRDSRVATGIEGFAQDGLWQVGAMVAVTLVALPALRVSLRLVVLFGLQASRPPAWLHRAFRWHERLGPWAMLEVFLFGALIAYTRMVDMATVQIGPAAYSLGGLVLLLSAADATLARQAVWQALERRGCTRTALRPAAPPAAEAEALPPASRRIGCGCCRLLLEARDGQACPRCGSTLHRRRPDSTARCWALIASAAILYVPANTFPVMNILRLGQGGPHTILGGVVEFVENGYWPLAAIVFLASVAIPMLKLLGLAAMLLGIRLRSSRHLAGRTRLYRFIDAIGRWSMIDVFVVSVLIALVRFGEIANISAELGAACFGAVVVLTIFAAQAFDPRLMWDAAPPDGRGR